MNDSFELVRQVLRILNFVSYVCLSVAICFSFFSALDILDNQFFSEYRICMTHEIYINLYIIILYTFPQETHISKEFDVSSLKACGCLSHLINMPQLILIFFFLVLS